MSDYIPEEEILKWLPVKTLLRFRCVCKSWKEVIDSPLFVRTHLVLQKSRLLIKYEEDDLLVLDPGSPPSFSSSMRFDTYYDYPELVGGTPPSLETLSLPSSFAATLCEQFRFVGTLHGVVCLYDNIQSFLIWNPYMRKFSIVTFNSLDFDWDDDDVEDLPYCGFWINPSDKHFKIIMFKLVYDDDPNGLVDGILYSSINQNWVSVPLDELESLRPYGETPPVIIDGVAYWRANYEYTDDEGKELLNIKVLQYDFSRECFDIIEVPNVTHYNGRYHPTLFRLNDELALVSWELGESDRCDVHVWVGDDDWVNIMAFGLDLAPVFRVLYVVGDTEENCKVVAETGEDLVVYDTKYNYDVMKSGLKNCASMYLAYDLVESLLFP